MAYYRITLLLKGHYATSWKVAGSIPQEIIVFFSIYLSLLAAQ
jgi:hypothetical protein